MEKKRVVAAAAANEGGRNRPPHHDCLLVTEPAAVAALTSTAPLWARCEAALLRELGKGPRQKKTGRGVLVRHVAPPVTREARRTRAAAATAAEDENDHGDGAAPHAPRSAPSGCSGAPPTGACPPPGRRPLQFGLRGAAGGSRGRRAPTNHPNPEFLSSDSRHFPITSHFSPPCHVEFLGLGGRW